MTTEFWKINDILPHLGIRLVSETPIQHLFDDIQVVVLLVAKYTGNYAAEREQEREADGRCLTHK